MNNHSHRFRSVLCLVALGAIGSPLVAQEGSSAAGVAAANRAARANEVAYSADRVTVSTQTLADGTKITHKNFSKVYQDSQGRTRYESFATKAETGEPDDAPSSISIHDPVAGVSYYLNPAERTAQRHEVREHPPLHSSSAGASANVAPARPPRPRPTVEDLGTQVIEGLEAKGERVTMTVPEGAEGNDRPLEIIRETWVATKGRIVLMSSSKDPRRGETTMRLSNLVLDEPPAELFQVPVDYTIQELQTVSKPEPASD